MKKYFWIILIAGLLSTGAGFMDPKDVSFTAKTDGTTQKYVVLLPEGFKAGDKHDLMIALHGHGSDRWQYVNDMRSECKGARDVAAKYNMIYVSPDYRAKTSWMGMMAELDMVEIISGVKLKYKTGKTFLVGASMGGTSVLIFMALHPDLVDGVVSNNGTANMVEYNNFLDAIQVSYGGTKSQVPDEYKARSAEFAYKEFTMPAAFTVGERDTAVPPYSVKRLYKLIKEKHPDNVLLIDREKTGHQTSYEDTVTSIEFVVKKVLGIKDK